MSYRDPTATWFGSPNYSPGRPNGIKWIVLHTMVGTTEAANARFQNPESTASAHYGVSEDGSLCQWVDEGNTAWHAGDFTVNQYSIGIEHEDGGNYNSPRPDALYATSSALVARICARYGIPIQRGNYAQGIPGCIDHRTVYATACPDSLDTNRIITGAAQEASMSPQQAEIDYRTAYFLIRFGEPQPEELAEWMAKGTDDETVRRNFVEIVDSPEGIAFQAKLRAAVNGTPPPDDDSKYALKGHDHPATTTVGASS